MATANLTPLTLDELDEVAGGLSDPDKTQLPPDSTTQGADGAAFEQTQTETPQDRFAGLMQDFGDNHTLDLSTPQQIAALSGDIADGKLDAQLGTLVDTVGQLDATKDAPELAKLAGALLDRFADFGNADRPAALAGLLDKPAFQPDKLVALSDSLLDSEPRAGIAMLADATQAYDDAGRTAPADTLRDATADQLGEVLTDAAADGDKALADTITWASQALEGTKGAAWTMVDALLDTPATDRTEAALAQSLFAALKSDLDPEVAGRLLAEGVVTPNALAAGLLQNYDPVTDNPASFEAELKAIALEAGTARAGFEAILRATTFEALVRESADGTLDAAELKQAAGLLLADRSLPADALDDRTLLPVFKAIGETLGSAFNSTFITPPTMKMGEVAAAASAHFLATAAVLRELGDAGSDAIALAVVGMWQNVVARGRDVNLVSLVQTVSDSPLTALVVSVELAAQLPTTYTRAPQFIASMAAALNGDGTVDTLSQAVLKGEIDGIAADKLIADLAARGGVTTPGLVAWRQAELAMAVAEGGDTSSQIVLDLKADLAASPSPLIAAAVQRWASPGANETLKDLIEMADAVDADVSALLVRVFTEGKVTADVGAMAALVPLAIAGLIAEGELTADEARAMVRSACSALVTSAGADALNARIAAELSEARLVVAANAQTTIDADAGSQLRELRDEYRAAVANGTQAMDVIRAGWHPAHAVGIIEVITTMGAASSTFVGSLIVDALEELGAGTGAGGKQASESWQYRDALRAELNRVLTGDAATQASWVSALQQAVSGGQQTAAEIVAELELIVENAFARERLSTTGDHYNMNDAARLSVRNMWDGLDRLVAATGVALLANAGTSATARAAALDWFREQTPGGQAAILLALPVNHAERSTLNTMAAAQLDTYDWAAERRNVEQTISIGNYAENSSKWVMFKAEQARDDLRGAVQLARLVGESALDPIVDMARAWQVMPTDTVSAELSHVRNAVALVAFETLSAARGNAAFGDALAQEVKTREATSAQVRADIATVHTLALQARNGLLDSQYTINSQYYLSANNWTVLIQNVTSDFTAGLVRAGMPNEAAALFVTGIESGAGLASLNGITSRYQAALALEALIGEAVRLGASVDHVLVSALDPANRLPPDSTDAARAILQARFDQGKVGSDLVAEVKQGDMSAAAALEVLRDAATHANRSFGSLLAGILDGAQNSDTKTYGILSNAAEAYGAGGLALGLGGDVAAGRIDAAGAIAATLEIAQALKCGADILSALLVGTGKNAAATDLAARAIAELPKFATLATEAGRTEISGALDAIRSILATNNLPLVTANTAALTALAGLYVAGAVNAGDIGPLIDQFDGKIPDAALVGMLDTINSLPDSPRQDALEYLVSDRLADRIESGALFTDALVAMQATFRSGTGIDDADATAILQMVEKAVAGAAYSGYYDEAIKQGAPTTAIAAARADALVAESMLLHQATGAYQLFKAADAANVGTAPSYVLWLINAHDQTNRDLVMGGMWMEMATKIGADGTVPADVQARYTAMQNELMAPELRALEGGLREALGNPAAFEAAKMAAAASIAADIGRITSRFASEVHDVSNSSAAAAVTTGDSDANLRDEIIAHGTQWAVVLGSAYRNYLASGPSGIAMSVAFGVTAQLLKVEAFRDFIGEGIAMPLDLGLKALGMVRSVVIEGMTVWTNGQIDAAMGAWEGTNDFFSGLASGDVSAAGEALLKLAEDINTLLNFTDFRGQFEVMKAMINKAVEQITIAFNALADAIDGFYEADKQYDRNHKLGMSFL